MTSVTVAQLRLCESFVSITGSVGCGLPLASCWRVPCRVEVGTGQETFLVPQASDHRRLKSKQHVDSSGRTHNVLVWSATFLQAALHCGNLHVSAWLVRSGADCSSPVLQQNEAFQSLLKAVGCEDLTDILARQQQQHQRHRDRSDSASRSASKNVVVL